jgi:GNAT superfamily N-acetyltransferase
MHVGNEVHEVVRAMKDASPFEIVALNGEQEILGVLERDRAWAAYALCDLDLPYSRYARFVGARRSGKTCSVVLVYDAGDFATIVPVGDADGVDSIMRRISDLPPRISLSVRLRDLPAIEHRYRVTQPWIMLRMAVRSSDIRPVTEAALPVRRLGPGDLSAIEALYATLKDGVFSPLMLDHGIYIGAEDRDTLVAIAGTHVVSVRFGMAAIGGVFTAPAYRGRGLATVLTGMVAQAVRDIGVRDLVLNVRETNAAAITAYTRLGFTVVERFWEGPATLLDCYPT